MSASFCIGCDRMVSSYEKYCSNCVKTYGVVQDEYYWKTHSESEWTNRKEIFESDKRFSSPNPVPSKTVQTPNTAKHSPLPAVYQPRYTNLSTEQRQYMKRFGSRKTRSKS